MKKNIKTNIILSTTEKVPVFIIKDNPVESKFEPKAAPEELSFFDIKQLYDTAYAALEAGRDDYKAKEIMSHAIKLDMAYRCQLARRNNYKKQSQMNDFRIISNPV